MAKTKQQIRVLLADDHEVVRDGLRGMLAGDPGLQVVGEASDGAEALELVDGLAPDVILMDLRMRGLGGVGTIRALGERNVPARVLVLTTYRPAEMALAQHPFLGITNNLRSRGVFDEIALTFLSRADVDRYLALAFP